MTVNETQKQNNFDNPRRVDALSRGAVRVLAESTYNATEIKGVQMLNKGTGNLILSFIDEGTDIEITSTELTAMGDALYEEKGWHLDSITTGAGMTLMVYV